MLIGREKEVARLNELYERDQAELVAIYGRRRVGKTFLVDEVFSDRLNFRHSGLSPLDIVKEATRFNMSTSSLYLIFQAHSGTLGFPGGRYGKIINRFIAAGFRQKICPIAIVGFLRRTGYEIQKASGI